MENVLGSRAEARLKKRVLWTVTYGDICGKPTVDSGISGGRVDLICED